MTNDSRLKTEYKKNEYFYIKDFKIFLRGFEKTKLHDVTCMKIWKKLTKYIKTTKDIRIQDDFFSYALLYNCTLATHRLSGAIASLGI